MRLTLCDRCKSKIPDPDDVYIIKIVSQFTKLEYLYELCDNCKAKFHKFLKEEGGCDAL